MAHKVGGTGLDSFEIRLVQVSLGNAAVALEGTDSGHQHAGAGGDAGIAALDIQELLGTQICTEACLRDDVIGQREAELGGHDAVAAVGNVGKGAAVDDGGVVFQRLNEVRVKGILEQRGHGTGGTDVASRDGLAFVGVGADDLRQPLLQVGDAGGQAEDRHDLAGNGDIKAVLTGGTVHLAAQTIHDEAELAVVHIHAALPGDAAGIDVQGVALLDAVVDHGSQQVVCGADGMQVTGKVEIDILHGHHLGIAAAGRAALDTEHGAKAGLTQAEHGLFAQSVHGIGQAHAGGGFALACRGGADGRDQDHLALPGCLVDEAVVDLGLVAAIGDHILIGKAQRGSDLGDGLHFGFLCDLDIRLHAQILPEMQKGQLCAPIAQGCPDGRRNKTRFCLHCGAPQRSVSRQIRSSGSKISHLPVVCQAETVRKEKSACTAPAACIHPARCVILKCIKR